MKKNKKQGWRANRKKYYVSRSPGGKKKPASRSRKPRKRAAKEGRLPRLPENLKKKIVIAIVLAGLAGLLSVAGYVAWITRGLPDPDKLSERELAQSTKILDRTGETVLYEIHGEEKRTLVQLEDIPDYIKWATIAMEDKNFYEHGGISILGILRGVIWNKIRGERVAGGSTLTQQFVKNAILTPERKVSRKIKEWILSYKLEQKYSKDEILQLYFNEIPYGSTAYGVEAASSRYFGKSAKDINLAEAAILAALPQAPSKYSPYGSNRDLLIGRQHYILDLMVAQGYISAEEAEEAKNYELEFKDPVTDIKAPHFVMLVKEALSAKYGEKMVEQGGLKIYTTLDMYKQEIAEEVIEDHAEDNEENYDATNASLVSIDPKTGQILAMVGSRDYFDDEIDGQVNIATSLRQPGSSMKPLVYTAAFIKGYTPDTILYDVVTNFSEDKEDPYEPHNYDLEEHGPVTIRKALAGSLNVPAVKALYLADVNNVIDIAADLGYTTLTDPDRYGLSLVLGGAEVKLLEHVNAYSAFAREGVVHSIVSILRVEDKDGNILEEHEENEGRRVLDPKIARMTNDILSDNGARAYAFGESNWLTLGSRPVAAKTGTTNDYRDAWTVGYTPSLVAGVWVGNNNNTEMKRGAAGGVVAAPIWHDYMQRVLGDTPVEAFREPEIPETGKPILDGEAGAAVPVKIDTVSGLLATEHTPEHLTEEKIFYEPHCILYFVDKDDPRGEIPEDPESDPQFKLWEERVIEWAEKKLASSTEEGAEIASSAPPTEFDNVHSPENQPQLVVLSPGNNRTITRPLLNARVRPTAPRGIDRVEYYINDILFYTNRAYPYHMEKRIDFLKNGYHNLKIRACDDVDNCTTVEREFNLNLENNERAEPLEVKLLEPRSGLAASSIDFPLQIRLELNNPPQAAVVRVNYINEDGVVDTITRLTKLNNFTVPVSWEEPPSSGTYKIYAEALAWSGETITTDNAIIIITNLNDK